MNTNGNLYTIVYTTIIVVLVAAVLAFAASSLKDKQNANIKAETVSQMLTAAQFASKEDLARIGNEKVLDNYAANIKAAYLVNANGEKVRDLATDRKDIELADGLKAQNVLMKNGKNDEIQLPVYVFAKDGKDITVVPIYGAGLWGPVWGYMAFEPDMKTLVGAYFDHESETPGLGAKIKDEPSFRAQFVGKTVRFDENPAFSIVKGGAAEGRDNAIDAITGATMTSKGLDAAINAWLAYYKPFFAKAATKAAADAVRDSFEAIDSLATQKAELESAAAAN